MEWEKSQSSVSQALSKYNNLTSGQKVGLRVRGKAQNGLRARVMRQCKGGGRDTD